MHAANDSPASHPSAAHPPASHLWGAQTSLAIDHFAVADERMPSEVIHALARIKQAAALVNTEVGGLNADLATRIARAADEVASGKHDAQFPLTVWQSGSGTQTNMNVNEVIATLAGADVHPNDHVNRSQCTNDTFPTAMHVASAWRLRDHLLPALAHLREVFEEKAVLFGEIVKIGRTHLMDATPLMVGQEISGWASLLERDEKRLRQTLDCLNDVALGGTAVGTGVNSHSEFASRAVARLGELTGLPLREHPNRFAALSAHDELADLSAALRTLAGSLLKIANDIRLLASGPRSGLGEYHLPENEPGSSIMPGKVNPTQCEMLSMVCVQVYGNDAAVAFAASQGHLQLNAFKPVMIANVLRSLRLLGDACRLFTQHCALGLTINRQRIEAHVSASLMLVTALVPHLGYDRAAAIARMAHQEGITLREACIQSGELNGERFDALVRAHEMTRPGIKG